MYRTCQDLVLASSSPRRREMFSSCGLAFRTVSPECDESPLPGEEPAALVERLAVLKAQTAALASPQSWIVAADTIVVLDGKILGKPSGKEEAFEMLTCIAGRVHEVYGGVALFHGERGIKESGLHVSEVEMSPMSPELIRNYIESGEPMDKAGSYAIQGIGASLVSRVNGSYTNVVGLNLSAIISLLVRHGVVAAG